MKKKVKALIIAASVAAVAGIGAVSFAKWEAGSNNSKTVEENKLGAVSVLTFGDSTIAAITGLKPLDQDSSITSANYAEVKFKVAASAGYDKSDFKLTVTVSDITLGTPVDSNAKAGIYVSTTAPTALSTADPDYTALTYTLDASADHEYSLYVWLQSDNVADMNKTFKLKYELSAGTTAKS